MTAHSDTSHASSGSGTDTAALVLIVIGLAGGVVMLFYKPFLVALPTLVITMVGIRLSDRHRRLGLIVMFAITIAFVIGAAFTVWDSRSLY